MNLITLWNQSRIAATQSCGGSTPNLADVLFWYQRLAQTHIMMRLVQAVFGVARILGVEARVAQDAIEQSAWTTGSWEWK
jgi:hypothetical protein